jgi:DNA-binding NarL/FixJ family response regulator
VTGAGSLPGPAAGLPPGPASGVIRVLVAEDMRILRDTMVAVLNLVLVKDTPAATLAGAVRTVAAGGRVIDPQLALAALEVPDNPLSPREAVRIAAQGRLAVAPATLLSWAGGVRLAGMQTA